MTGLFRRCLAVALGLLIVCAQVSRASPAFAITAPELRGQFAVKEITADMHGLDLKEKEFLKADLRDVDLSGTDLRGAVINTYQMQGADLSEADIEDVVAFACLFDVADLRGANFTNAMMMQSRFTNVVIEGADFTNGATCPATRSCASASGEFTEGIETREPRLPS